MATLKFNNIQKIYPNHVQAVFDFNLEIKDKEFIVFVGPSGCGKSTTLRMVAGLEEISDGELFIDNRLVNFIDAKNRNVAMVFQSYALYPHMTVYDNIGFSLKIRKIDCPVLVEKEEKTEIDKKITALRRQFFKKLKKANRTTKNREALEKEALEIRKQIDNLLVQYHKFDEKVIGSCKLYIDRYTKAEKRTLKDINSINKKIANAEKVIKKEEDKLASYKNELNQEKDERIIKRLNKKIKKLTGTIDYDHHVLNSFKIELNSKVKENQDAIKNKEYYSNNKVEVYQNRHLSKNEIFERAIHAADVLDLYKYLCRKPAALSGGQRQRVALGRAIVRKPKVFLMDEPLSNLDAKLRAQTRTEIARIHKDVGATTIYVTHDQVEALTLADRIVIMKDGVVQQVCTPKEAYEQPSNIFVAGFIGSPATNFLEGVYNGKTIEIKNGNASFNIKLTTKFKNALKAYVKKKVIVGIRPEFMHLSSEYKGKDSASEVALTCKQFELIGHEYIVYFDINGQKLAAKTTSKAKIEPGKKDKYSIEIEKIHIFDCDSTKKII